MKLTVDEDKNRLLIESDGKIRDMELYSDESFRELSRIYTKVSWNQKYAYTFTWMGRPVIQLPDDMLRIQELIFAVRPDVIVETGVAHGGSLIFYSSLFRSLGKGRAVGIDIEIRPHNRKAIEEHPLSDRISLIEGNAVDPAVVDKVRSLIKPDETVLVILDSNHTYDHVAKELECYSSLVSKGSYIVATDGVMRDLADVPRGDPRWRDDNPARAAEDFAAANKQFVLEQPGWPFNESGLRDNVTYWPSAYLRKIEVSR